MLKVKVVVPATCTNLGFGTNSLGLALMLHNTVEMSLSDGREQTITIQGESTSWEPHPVIQAVNRFSQATNRDPVAVTVTGIGEIPVNCGLGDKAAWHVGGLVAVNNLFDRPLSREQIIELASSMGETESAHATAILGGLTVTSVNPPIYRRLELNTLKVVIVVPNLTGLDKAQVMSTASQAILAVEALRKGDMNLLKLAMSHPFRNQTETTGAIPGYDRSVVAAKEAGAAAVAISSVGPAIVAFAADNHARIARAMQGVFQSVGVTARTWTLNVDTQGIAISMHK